MTENKGTVDLAALAAEVAKQITETNQRRMGFNMEEIDRINQALWDYECAINKYATEYNSEAAMRLHYELDEDIQTNIRRAFSMFGRKLETCAGIAPTP